MRVDTPKEIYDLIKKIKPNDSGERELKITLHNKNESIDCTAIVCDLFHWRHASNFGPSESYEVVIKKALSCHEPHDQEIIEQMEKSDISENLKEELRQMHSKN